MVENQVTGVKYQGGTVDRADEASNTNTSVEDGEAE